MKAAETESAGRAVGTTGGTDVGGLAVAVGVLIKAVSSVAVGEGDPAVGAALVALADTGVEVFAGAAGLVGVTSRMAKMAVNVKSAVGKAKGVGSLKNGKTLQANIETSSKPAGRDNKSLLWRIFFSPLPYYIAIHQEGKSINRCNALLVPEKHFLLH
jgi:hypothetical protein